MNDEHGPKKFNIFVNGQRKTWEEESITYVQLVNLAFPNSNSEMFTVQYSRGPQENPDGTLVSGQNVKVKSGMSFDVSRTDKS